MSLVDALTGAVLARRDSCETPDCTLLFDVTVLEGSGEITCVAENSAGVARCALQFVVDDHVAVNACPLGYPVLSMTPVAMAAFLFGALHQVHTLSDLSYTQGTALLAASAGDVRKFVRDACDDFFEEIPQPRAPPCVWKSARQHARIKTAAARAGAEEEEEEEGKEGGDDDDEDEADEDADFECGMCEDELPACERQALADCAHEYCRRCLAQFVESLVEDIESFTNKRFKCPDPDCGTQIHPGIVMQLLPPDKQRKFLQLTVRTCVHACVLVRACTCACACALCELPV